MKKITALLLIFLTAVSFASCAENSTSAETDNFNSLSGTSKEDSESESDTEYSEKKPDDTQADETENTVSETDDSDTSEESAVLVAYFSATNTTEGIAEYIAEILDADLYEISPEEPYTDDDLDYNDDKSRTTVEMNDPDARPAISGSVENIDKYDVVFIGYPIWWGDAPRIISTFLESYDFSGKTIAAFCTSGGSDIDASVLNLKQFAENADWLGGQRFSGGSDYDEIEEWINSLDLYLTS